LLSRQGVTLIASVVMAALVAPGAGAHDGVMTAAGHAAEDAVTLTAAQERALDAHTRAVSAPDARAAAVAVADAPHDVGQWGPVVDWPVVGVHVALLPNGKVLAYDSRSFTTADDDTRATVWDPATGTQTPVTVDTGFNIFCSGLAHLADGRMFMAGGNKEPGSQGIVQTHLFDSMTNRWSLGPNMAAGRWYPTVTPLNNGEMLITAGRVDTPEVRTLAGGLRALSTASLSLPLYPWIDVAPNGLAFHSGPDQALRTLDTAGTGTWQTLGQRDGIYRDYGGHTLFDVGKLLVAGGGPSTSDARVVDLNGPTPQVSTTAPMAYGRRQHNLTVLADGTVLATGGNSSGAPLVDLDASVYPAEQWNPATGQWRTLAAMQITRQYHSTALLLPDGRVLSSGGGICGTCDQVGYLAKNAEIFSPPYLFEADGTLAPRPAIAAAPTATSYGAAMEIATANPASIRKVALVRLGAVTHSVNMEQRYIPLSFTAGAASISATAPANANVAPPGPYMLFIIDANGVPSVARIVSVQDTVAPTATITQAPSDPSNDTSPAFAFSANETGSRFECKLDAAAFATCTSPKAYTGLADGQHTFAVRATDVAGNQGAADSYAWRIDTTPPATAITDRPGSLTNDGSATFSFTANEPGSSFSCRIDAADFAPCSSPQTYTDLADGNHTVSVRATDTAGNVGPARSYTWTVDTDGPTATITSKPSSPTNSTAPSFGFTVSEAGSSFVCRLDGGAFAPCFSPKGYTGLADGLHSFEVKATDQVGNTGTVDAFAWTIDTVAPSASITTKPTNPSRDSSPSFAFLASEAGSSFSCRVDAQAFAACVSVRSYPVLADGPHTFEVRATDAAGNTGAETTYGWTIDTVAPTVALTVKPTNPSNDGSPSFSFAASESGSSFSCRIDAADFAPCSSPATYHGLGDGAHAFSVRANDEVGNLSAPVGHSWTIDTTAPETTLAAAPTSGTATSATFAYSASERATFECRLDGAPFTLCGTPTSYASLGRGDHQFQVRAIDVAGNADPTPSLHGWRIHAPAAKKVASALLSPRAGAHVNRPPLLVWRRVTGARYYNVQVFRGRRKVFSGWPTRTRLQLKSKWRYFGRTERLLPGRYRWYVWLGYINPRRHGALLGRSTFLVPRASARR
jgi:Galactose oxidase-like, Early set domain